jgi:hypothetical protein
VKGKVKVKAKVGVGKGIGSSMFEAGRVDSSVSRPDRTTRSWFDTLNSQTFTLNSNLSLNPNLSLNLTELHP